MNRTLGVCPSGTRSSSLQAAPRAQDQIALQPEEKQAERIKLNTEALMDLDENSGDKLGFRCVQEVLTELDEKLKACFGNFAAEPDLIEGVDPLTESCVLKHDE